MIKVIGLLFLCFTVVGDEVRVLCLGDSLTAGYGVKESEAWPSLLQDKLGDEKYLIVNAGTSGGTTAGGLRKLPWLFKKPVDVMILALGANDGLRGLDTKIMESNLQKIIDKAREKNPKVRIILAGMLMPPNMGLKYTTEFAAVYPRLAFKNDIELIPFLLMGVAGIPDKNLPDGIHPNPKGHIIISEIVHQSMIKKQ